MVWQLYSVEGTSSASLTETPGCNQQQTSTRQAMYVQGNNEARTCKHCCSRKAISITYYEFVFVVLGIQHEMHRRYIVMCLAPLYTIFPHYLISGMSLEKKLLNLKRVFLFPLQLLPESFFHSTSFVRKVLRLSL
jgi:hypothetical protein